MNIYKKITLLLGILVSSISFGQNTSCGNMEPICTNAGLLFTAQSGIPAASTTDAGNNYGCLGSSPNPAWYYLEISAAGALNMSLSAAQDIDFIVYGPFPNLAAAQAGCGTMGTAAGAPIVDCSYSGTNNETPSIANAQVGEVYVMLVTNYANSVQDITLVQTSGAAATNCAIVVPCSSNPGTFVNSVNGATTADPIYLCEGEDFSIVSNVDYVLPNDTVAAPVGDGIYTAQLLWLVYTAPPVGTDPISDPSYTGVIIPSDDLAGVNDAADPFFQALGGNCGTYYFVPVAGDDGVGDGGANDNSGLHWDKDGNGCYLLGAEIPVTFACPMTVTPVINCTTLTNGMDIPISGGSGNYQITNQGDGNLVSGSVINNGTAQIAGMINNDAWAINITDDEGCTASANGVFSAPTVASVNISPALTCPNGSNGSVVATIGASGQPGYVVDMNDSLNVLGPNYTYFGQAGTSVTIIVTDNLGCVDDSIVTVTSAGHYIDIQIVAQTDEACFNDGNGSATITATGVDSNGDPDGSTITTIVWTDPNGVIDAGSANQLNNTGMVTGNWLVTVTDNTGCDVTIPVTINGPQEISINVFEFSNITCFEGNDGDITLESSGGSGNTTFSWDVNNPVAPASANATTANQLTVGVYVMYVTDDNGCTDTVSIELIQPGEITAWYTIKDVLCYGDNTGSIIIDSVTNNAGNVSYLWNLAPFTNPSATSNIASGLPIGSYEFKVVDDNFCENIYQVTIGQNDSIFWDELGFKHAICRSSNFYNGQGQVFAAAGRTAPGTGGQNFDYIWTEVGTGLTTTNTTWGLKNPGYYNIIAVDDYGCVLDSTIFLDSLTPIADFAATSPQFTSDYVGTAPVVVTFENLSQNYAFAADPAYGNDPIPDTSMTWVFGLDGDPYQTEEVTDLTRTYTEEGLYTVCLFVEENMNSCEDSTCIDIQIYDQPGLDIPNVFTPGVNGNGDGVNDLFFFPNVAIVEFQCTVFDRWGKEIFIFNDINTTWDGTNSSNGKACVDGMYFYVYKGESSNGTAYEGQGNVQLIRK